MEWFQQCDQRWVTDSKTESYVILIVWYVGLVVFLIALQTNMAFAHPAKLNSSEL